MGNNVNVGENPNSIFNGPPSLDRKMLEYNVYLLATTSPITFIKSWLYITTTTVKILLKILLWSLKGKTRKCPIGTVSVCEKKKMM